MSEATNLSFIAGKSQRRLHLIEFVLYFIAGCLLAVVVGVLGWGGVVEWGSSLLFCSLPPSLPPSVSLSLSQAIPVQAEGLRRGIGG